MLMYVSQQISASTLSIRFSVGGRVVVLQVKNGKAIIPSKIKGISSVEMAEIGEIVMNFNQG